MSARPKRQIKAPTRLIEQDEPIKLRPLDIDELKQIVKQKKEVVKSPIKTNPQAPNKSKKTEKRILDLDLDELPPSSDIKFSKDWSEWNNEFWLKHFYTPNDNTTQEYIEATDKLGDLLPANFRLIKGEPSAFGVANLELKDEYKKPIKKTPLFSKLVNGDYETASSKSDKTNIAGSVKFFYNNLASFKQYKNQDDITWVINNHRQLVAEILEYYADKEKTSLATIKSRFNAITRIFRLAFETKNYELYDKYSSLVIFLNNQFEDDEFDNELSELELKKFITFDIVLDKQKELQKQFELIQNKKSIIGFDLNQDLLLVSLYSLIPPLRNEPKTLKFTTESKNKDNWIFFRGDEVILDLNEEKKRHPSILFNLTIEAPELAKLLKESYTLYPREYLFTNYNKYPIVSQQASVETLTNRLLSIFSYTGKSIGVNSLRSSYVSYMNSEAIKNGKQLSVKQREKIAYRMRSSRQYIDEAYLKIFQVEQEFLKETKPKDIVVVPLNEKTSYEKQINRTKTYYEENKTKVLAQQKEYKNKKSPYEQSRIKMLYFLNGDPEYYKKMKEATKAKYNFKQNASGKWE